MCARACARAYMLAFAQVVIESVQEIVAAMRQEHDMALSALRVELTDGGGRCEGHCEGCILAGQDAHPQGLQQCDYHDDFFFATVITTLSRDDKLLSGRSSRILETAATGAYAVVHKTCACTRAYPHGREVCKHACRAIS